jgi:RND family efflux transporter MFP subunit
MAQRVSLALMVKVMKATRSRAARAVCQFLTVRRASAVRFIAAAIVGGVVWASCANEPSETALVAAKQPVLIGPESTARVEVRTLRSGPRISGALEARERATIIAEVTGAVRELNVELGQEVKEGQVLARIDPNESPEAVRSARAVVRSAEQALQLAQSQVERSQRLVDSGALATSKLEVDRNAAAAASAQVQQARAQLAAARESLARATIRSPIAGVVSAQPIHEGDIVAIGSPLLTVIDPSSIRLEAAVPASALPDLAIGTKVEFQVRSAPDQVFEGSITRIAPSAESATGLITILVSIPNTSGRVLAGLFADGRVAIESTDALAIPVSAIDRSSDPPQVTRIRDRVARQVPVELGVLDEVQELVEVRSGLRAGDRVVIGSTRDIVSGTPVRLVGFERAGAAAYQHRARTDRVGPIRHEHSDNE